MKQRGFRVSRGVSGYLRVTTRGFQAWHKIVEVGADQEIPATEIAEIVHSMYPFPGSIILRPDLALVVVFESLDLSFRSRLGCEVVT